MITGSEATGNQHRIAHAPLMEESLKGIAVRLIFLFKKDEFDGVLDGIIYAGVTALGFAMVENVEYYGTPILNGGIGGLLVSPVLRRNDVPLHPRPLHLHDGHRLRPGGQCR